MAQTIKWIQEPQAAEMLGYSDRHWFRKLVKERKIPVDYTSVNGRKFKYCEKGLNDFLLSCSNVSR